MARSSIAAHCKNCARAVTCLSSDVYDDKGNLVLDDYGDPQQSVELTGRCDGCGTVATVVPYTPAPFSGHPIDPRAPRMAAHVGPFGAVPTADALRPQVPTGVTKPGSALSTSSGVGAPLPATVAERMAGPAEGVAPPAETQPMNLNESHDARNQYDEAAYAPIQSENVEAQPIADETV